MSFIKSLVPSWISTIFSSPVLQPLTQHVNDWTPPKISQLSQLDSYRRSGGVMGCKSFNWDTKTLTILVQAYRNHQLQHHLQRLLQQDPEQLDLVALHFEICQHVKQTVVTKAMALCKDRALQCDISECEFNRVAETIQCQIVQDFDGMWHRWIRLPTIRAIQTKLGQCKYLARIEYDSESACASMPARTISANLQEVWSNVMHTE